MPFVNNRQKIIFSPTPTHPDAISTTNLKDVKFQSSDRDDSFFCHWIIITPHQFIMLYFLSREYHPNHHKTFADCDIFVTRNIPQLDRQTAKAERNSWPNYLRISPSRAESSAHVDAEGVSFKSDSQTETSFMTAASYSVIVVLNTSTSPCRFSRIAASLARRKN